MRRLLVIVTSTSIMAACASLPFGNSGQEPSAEVMAAKAVTKQQEEKAAQEKARSDFDSAYTKLQGLMDSVATSTPTMEQIDIAKGELIIVRALLGSASSWGPPTAELRVLTTSVSTELKSYRSVLQARELVASAHAYKGQLATAAMQIQTDIEALKTNTQTLALIESIESNFKLIAQIKIKSAKIEQEDAGYKSFISKVQSRLLDLQNTFVAKKGEIYVAAIKALMTSSSHALKTALAQLKANPKLASNFEAVQTVLKSQAKSLAEAKSAEDYQTALAKDIAASERVQTLAKKELAQFQVSYEVALQRREVKQAIDGLKIITTSFEMATDSSVFERAQKALEHVESVLLKGKAFEAKNKSYAQYAGAVRLGMMRGRAGINTAKSKWPIQQQTMSLKAAVSTMNGQLSMLKKLPSEENIAKLKASISALGEVLKAGKKFESKDLTYLRLAIAQRKEVRKQEAGLKVARANLKTFEQQSAVSLAAKLAADLAKTVKDEKGIAEAKLALAKLQKVLDQGKDFEAKDAKYKKFANAQRKKITQYEELIARAQIKIQVATAQLELERVSAEVDSLAATATDEAAFKVLETKMAAVDKRLLEQKALEKKSSSYKKLAKAKRASLGEHRTLISSARQKASLDAARIAIETARAELEEKVASASDSASFQVAAEATLNLARVLNANRNLLKSDKTFAQLFGQSSKYLRRSKKQIQQVQGAALIDAHRLTLEVAQAEAEGLVVALNADSAAAAYQKAANAVSSLSKRLESGMELGDANPNYGKYLKQMQANKNRLRAAIPTRRINVAKNTAEIALAQLAAGSEGASDAVKTAVATFVSVTKSNQTFSGASAEYKKFIKEMTALAKSMSNSIVKQRFSSAQAQVKMSLAALAAQPESEAYGPVEAAIRNMDALLREYADDKKHKKLSAKHRARVQSSRRKLVRYRISGMRDRARVLIGALDESSVVADFSESKELLGALRDAVEEAESDQGSDKKLTKFLAESEIAVKKLEKLVQVKDTSAKLRPEFEKMNIAVVTAKASVDILAAAEVSAKQIKAAKKAVDAAETTIFDASKHDNKSPGFAKKRGRHQKTLDKLKKKITRRERSQARAANQIAVEQACEAAEAAVSAVASSLDAKIFETAMAAVKTAKSVINEGKAYKSNKTYAKYLAVKRAALRGLETSSLRSFLSSAAAQMNILVGAVNAESDLATFGAADAAIDAFAAVIEQMENPAKGSKKLKVLVKKAEKKLPLNRAKLSRVRVAAAALATETQMEILRESKSEEALEMAIATNDVLAKTLKAHGDALKKGKGKKKLKALRKSIKSNRKEIARFDFALKTKPHREKIKAATQIAKASLEVLRSGSLDEKSYQEADKAVAALAAVVEDVPVLARSSKKYGKSLKAYRKRVRAYQAKINRYRYSGKIKIHKAQVAEARSNAKAMVKALNSRSGSSAYRDAEAAVVELGRIVRAGDEFSQKNRKYGKSLKATRKLGRKLKSEITSKRLKAVFARASNKIRRLKKSPTAELISEAGSAVDEAEKVISIVAAYQKGGKKSAKELKAAKKKVRRYRLSLARARAKARFALLTPKSEPEAYLATTEAIDDLRALIKVSKRFAKKDKKFKRLLAEAKKDVPRFRVRMKKRQIESAISIAKENLDEARRDPQAIALYEADESISDLEETLDAVKKLAKKNKKFGKFVKRAKKKARAYRKLLIRARLNKGSAAGR